MATKKKPTRTGKWEFYKIGKGSGGVRLKSVWRWRYTAPNGRVTKASTEGYSRKIDCVENARASGYTG